MDHPLQEPGMELATQEFLAATHALKSRREDLAPVKYARLREEIVDEYELHCTQERNIALAQVWADYALTRTQRGRASANMLPIYAELR